MDSKDQCAALPAVHPGLQLSPTNDARLLILSFSDEACHPADPLCMPFKWKAWMTFFAAVLVMGTALSSSAPSGAAPFIQADLGGNSALPLTLFLLGYVAGPFVGAPLSEAYGRRPVFVYGGFLFLVFTAGCAGAQSLNALLALRFLAGFFGSVPTTNSGAVCGDIWTARARGQAMAAFSVATFSGPALGPVVGSFSAVRLSWRWCFIILTCFQAVTFFLSIFACPETYAPVILSKLARELRESTGDSRIVSRLQAEEMASRDTPKLERLRSELRRILVTPLVMIGSESIVGFTTAYMSMVYGLIYLLFEAYPIIFGDVHGLAPGYSSLPFIATLVGAVVSVPLSLWFQKDYLSRVTRAGKPTPEMRLPPAQVGGLLTVVSFLWLGWSGYKRSTPWIVPTLSGVPQGVASVLIFRSLQAYLLDTYERFGASALAANVVARSVCGAVYPLFAGPMFRALGVQWACTLLAGVMLLLCPVPWVFERYGARIRQNSRFAPGRH
ncbi:hypothetical protein OIV83_006448 [Microbotryomycetes sp. JL201]|nr:hypothetical protein OIV83_006448 [Microbotryomycetes sp. JL201]